MSASRKPRELPPARMAPLARLPVFLDLAGRRAVVAGGNAAAAWKAELLAAAGARVDVFADAPGEELAVAAEHAASGTVAIHPRAWRAADLAGAAVAVGSFEDEAAAQAFAAAARVEGVPVNVVDRPAFCDFSFGAIVNRSPLVIGISTAGAAPVFAQAIRAKLEALLPFGFAHWAAAASRWRAAVKNSGLSFAGRRRFWQAFTARALRQPDRAPSEGDFGDMIAAVKRLDATTAHGTVTLVGAGPGDAELLTLRAVRALQSADVILFDDLVSRDILDFARREAKRMLVGKTGHKPSCRQDDINALMVGLARAGKRVVRLKGGDPLIFGRAGEEIAACRAAGIAVEIVPGISAAQGAAARLGMPLTDRAHAQRLQFVTGHAGTGLLPTAIDWRSLADPHATTAIYMPTRTLAQLVARAVAEGLDPRTPALFIANASRPDEAVIRAPIGQLPVLVDEAAVGGPALVVLGGVCTMAEAPATDHRRADASAPGGVSQRDPTLRAQAR